MKTHLMTYILLGGLVSCGAAKNSDSRGGNNTSTKTTTDQLAAGSDGDFQKAFRSQMYRNKESQQYSYIGEREVLAKNTLPKTHRTLVDMERDIDSNIVRPEKLASPELGCGNYNGIDPKQNISITARHNNCLEVQGDSNAVSWNGKNKAISGEGKWQLISNSSYVENEKTYNKTVWQDLTTGYLWGDTASEYTWEEAAGVGANQDTRPCLAISDAPKHELGRIHPSFVTWRLPNRNEFLLADINGSRFVLETSENENYIWTASYAGDNKAWAINVSTGQLTKMSTDSKLKARCLGVVLK